MKYKKYTIALVSILLMIIASGFFKQKEIIFPEFVALLIGTWLCDKQVWVANKKKFFTLLSFAAFFGVCLVKYISAPILLKICLAFVFSCFSLIISQSTLVPIISASILPIFFNVSSWIYPISVSILSLLVICGQKYFEKIELCDKNEKNINSFNIKKEMIRIIKLLVSIAIVGFFPVKSGNLFFIAPPLIVIFTEMSNEKSKMRKDPFKIWLTLTISAMLGVLAKIVPTTIGSLIAISVAFFALIFIFSRLKVLCPPAGAILVLPQLLDTNTLFCYPLEIMVGSAVFITIALFLFKIKEKQPIGASIIFEVKNTKITTKV